MEITIKGSAKEIIEFVNEIKNENDRDGSAFVTFDDLSEIFDFAEKGAPEEKADNAAEPQSQPKESVAPLIKEAEHYKEIKSQSL